MIREVLSISAILSNNFLYKQNVYSSGKIRSYDYGEIEVLALIGEYDRFS